MRSSRGKQQPRQRWLNVDVNMCSHCLALLLRMRRLRRWSATCLRSYSKARKSSRPCWPRASFRSSRSFARRTTLLLALVLSQ
eukprot:8846392-Pyramimonas_sp.AAC.1